MESGLWTSIPRAAAAQSSGPPSRASSPLLLVQYLYSTGLVRYHSVQVQNLAAAGHIWTSCFDICDIRYSIAIYQQGPLVLRYCTVRVPTYVEETRYGTSTSIRKYPTFRRPVSGGLIPDTIRSLENGYRYQPVQDR